VKNISPILKKLLVIGVFAILAISPTQYAIEIREKMYLSAVDPAVWGVFLLLLVCFAMRLVRLRPPSLFGSLLILVVGLSAMKTSNRMSSFKELFQVVEYFAVAYMLFAFLISDPKRRTAAVYVFAGIGTVIVFLALIQYLRPGLSSLEVAGTFGNRNVLGGYMALLLPLMVGLMLYEKNRVRLVWYAATVTVGLLVNLSGGSVMGVLVALAIVVMLRGRLVFAGLTVLLLLAVFVVVPLLPRDNAEVLRESVHLFDDDGNVSPRYTEWQAAAAMTQRNPVLGVGAGNYQENIGMHYGILPDPIGATESDTQNLYMVTASSIGLIGLAAFMGLLCYSGAAAIRQYGRAETDFDRGLAVGLLGSVVAFSIACIWSPLLVRGISIPLVFVLCLADHCGATKVDKPEMSI
jgi:O-antigen ligase